MLSCQAPLCLLVRRLRTEGVDSQRPTIRAVTSSTATMNPGLVTKRHSAMKVLTNWTCEARQRWLADESMPRRAAVVTEFLRPRLGTRVVPMGFESCARGKASLRKRGKNHSDFVIAQVEVSTKAAL
jgi:hypothetical protein